MVILKFSIAVLLTFPSTFSFASSYSDLIQYALKSSSRVREIKEQTVSQTEGSLINQGLFPYRVFGTAAYRDAENPVTGPFSQVANESTDFELGVEKPLSLGVTPYVSYSTLRSAQTTLFNNTQTIDASFKSTELKAGVRSELLKSLILGKDRSIKKESELNKKLLLINQELQIEEFLKQMINQALNYYVTSNSLNYAKEKCQALKEFYQVSQKRRRTKIIEEKEFLIISSQYQGCKLEVASLKTSANNSLLLLKSLLDGDTSIDVSNIKLDWPFLDKKIESNADQLLKMSEQRLDVKSALLAVATKVEAYKKVSFETMPSLNLDASVGYTGADLGSLSKASEQTLDRDFANYNITLSFSMPFGDSAQKSLKNKNKSDLRVQKEKLNQLKNTVTYELATTTEKLNYLKDSIKARQKIKDIELKKWKIFKRDFKRGRVKFRDLLDNQNSYIAALESLSQTKYQYSITYLTYLMQTGQSLTQL